MSFKTIAATLQKEGLIRYRGYFEIIGRLQGISRKVRTGYYGLSTNMTMWDVLDALRKGKIIEYEVLIPEGYNLYQIGWTLSGTPLVSDPEQVHQTGEEQGVCSLPRHRGRLTRRLLVSGHVLSAQGDQA